MKKRWFALLTAAVMLLSLTACNTSEIVKPMTAETLLEKTNEAMADREMTSGHGEMVLDMSITAEGETMDMAMAMKMDILASSDPYAAYTDMTMDMTMLGETMSEKTEQYIVVEDDQVLAYSYTESYDTWTVTEMDLDDAMMTANYNWLADKDPADVKLAEEKELINEREAYVLSCTVTGDEMDESLSMLEDTLADSGLDGMDMSSLEIPVKLWIDAKDFRIVQMDLDMQSMETFMNDMFDSLMGELGGGEVSVSFKEISYVFSDLGYDPVVVPPLPEEAKEDAISMDEDFELEDDSWEDYGEAVVSEDGVYTLSEGDASINVIIPNGWSEDYAGYDELCIVRDDELLEGYYLMFDEGSYDEFNELIETWYIDEYTVDHGAGEEIDGIHTVWLTTNDGESEYNMYFAFGEIGGGWLYLEAIDYSGSADMDIVLTNLLENIIPDGESI